MKATKDHISLKTAKLLKDCGVESKHVWQHRKEWRLTPYPTEDAEKFYEYYPSNIE